MFCWSIPHQQPSPVISPLLSTEISLLLTFIIHLLIFSLSHKCAFLITGDVHTALLQISSFNSPSMPTACIQKYNTFGLIPPLTGTHHPLPALNEDINTPDHRVHSMVPFNPAVGYNLNGHCYLQRPLITKTSIWAVWDTVLNLHTYHTLTSWQLTHPSIHSSSSAYRGSVRGSSSFSREDQTSLSLATWASTFGGIPRHSKARGET